MLCADLHTGHTNPEVVDGWTKQATQFGRGLEFVPRD
jgi:hypothetical protein